MSTTRFPRMFGKYALLRPFARGGMGEIYLAASGDLGGAEKLCLIKKVPQDRDAPGLHARLLDEAKVTVRLNHTNLVQVFDTGQVGTEVYIAMELIEGRDLRAVWNRTAERRSRIPLDVALLAVREIARGLEYAHSYGGLNLVHRDIAPPNVLLSWHGEVKITDFGLARSILKNERTAPGIVYGRISYLSPEQARGEQADARTDVFASGVILWELLTGRPMRETSDEAVKNLEMARHPKIDPPSRIIKSLPASLDQVVMKALATERSSRFQSAGEFRQAISEELARVAPGIDTTRLTTFLRDLYGDEIEREVREHARLLREELPRMRQNSESPRSPSSGSSPGFESEEKWLAETVERPLHITGVKESVRIRQLETVQSQPRGYGPGNDMGSDDGDERTHVGPAPSASRERLTAAPVQVVIEETDPADLAKFQKLIGQLIDGRYNVVRLIGTGGMGAVYEAEHIDIGKLVALKVLHPQYSREADLVARFRREARAASKVGHPNIVDVTDSGTTATGDVYFVMERLDGLDLGEVLRHERKIAVDRTVRIGIQICRALSAAHASGIIHRDLKPENVFLVARDGNPDFVKVLDFGIAKHDVGNQNSPRRLTSPGIAVGTPEYMAPEQAAGLPIDARVDVYAVGAILYEMLTGQPPFAGTTGAEVLAQKASSDPLSVSSINRNIPSVLSDVVQSCLSRVPEKRPQTMGALEYELIKSMKGRGSAVAAMLGIQSSNENEEARSEAFDFAPSRNPSSPSLAAIADGPNPQTSTVRTNQNGDETVRDRAYPKAVLSETTPAPRWEIRPSAEEPAPTLLQPAAPGPKFPTWMIVALVTLAIISLVSWTLHRRSVAAKAIPPAITVMPLPKAVPLDDSAEREAKAHEAATRAAEITRLLGEARATTSWKQVQALLDQIGALDPENAEAKALRQTTSSQLQQRGAAAYKKSHWDESIRELEGAVTLTPDDDAAKKGLARSLATRSLVLGEKHKWNAALIDADRAVSLDGESVRAHLGRADAYSAQGKFAPAADEYRRVVELHPGDKRARRGLAIANAQAKKAKTPKVKSPPAPKKR